jgi:hypothetical protein
VTGSFKVLDLNQETQQAIVAFCFGGDDLSVDCNHDQLDIFIWSRNRPDTSLETKLKEELMTVFNKYCVKNESDVIIADTRNDTCMASNQTLIEDRETETEPMLIAELKLTDISSMLNDHTNDSLNFNSSILELPLSALLNVTSQELNDTTTLDLIIDLDALNDTTLLIANTTKTNDILLNPLMNETKSDLFFNTTQSSLILENEMENKTYQNNTTLSINSTEYILTTQSSVTTSIEIEKNVTFSTITFTSSPVATLLNDENRTNLTFVANEKVNLSASILDETFLESNFSDSNYTVQTNETETTTTLEPALIVFKKDQVFFDEKNSSDEVNEKEEANVSLISTSTIPSIGTLEMATENVTEIINSTTEQTNIEETNSTTSSNQIDTLEALEKLEMEVEKNLTENNIKNETLAEDKDKDLVIRENEDSKENNYLDMKPEMISTEINIQETSTNSFEIIDVEDDEKSTEDSLEQISETNTSEIESTTVTSKNEEELVDEDVDKSSSSDKVIDEEEKIDEEVEHEEQDEEEKKEDTELESNDNEENESLNNQTDLNKDIQIEETSTDDLLETTMSTTEEIQTTTTTTPFPCAEKQCPILSCNHGRKKDANNCDMCECLKNPNSTAAEIECTTPYCHPCFYGSFSDENGCDSCACKPRPKPKSIYECPKLECPSCNYGSIKDEYGCETCICIRPNSLERSYPCPPEPTCPYGSCKHGSVLNEYGCATCDCLKSTESDREECSRQRCPACPNGYFTDADGCETCSCKPDWMAPCALSELSCDLTKCQYGSYLDRNGCPSCECLPNPDFNIDCKQLVEINPESQCDADGAFKVKQCNDQGCRCVTKYGIPISDFKASLADSEYMNCECALALYDVSVYKAIGFKLYCAPNGNYETIQCVGGSCACVNEHGDPLGPSVPIYQKHLLRCEGVFQRFYFGNLLNFCYLVFRTINFG